MWAERAFRDPKETLRSSNTLIDAYRLWWTCETVLITSPWNWLISMSFDQVGNWIVRAFAMHDLLSGVVRIHDVSPSNITKIFALSELFHRFTDLWKKEKQSVMVTIQESHHEMSWLTLYCLFLSEMVCPSFTWTEVEHGSMPEGHRHCFSTHGLLYVSTLLQTLFGLQTGKDASEFWNTRSRRKG